MKDSTVPQITFNKSGGKLKSKHKYSINIKKENRGKFTRSAKEAGQSVLEHAKSVLKDKRATKLLKKRALFAVNAKRFKH